MVFEETGVVMGGRGEGLAGGKAVYVLLSVVLAIGMTPALPGGGVLTALNR